jgi:hypothetical protein
MTSRMSLAYVAIAALALITSGVRAAYALSFCDIYPNRCQYTPSGKGYYYPQGYRLPSEMPGFGAGNGASTQARGSWGCAATDGTAKSGSFGYPNRASAAYGALSQCAKHGGNCRIIGCSSSVHNAYEGRAIFFAHR